jgi:hypothetical protein
MLSRIFSLINTVWSNEKSRLSVETTRATLVVRQNCVMECEKFYDKVLEDRNLLRKIISSEKYSRYDHGETQSPSLLLVGWDLRHQVLRPLLAYCTAPDDR